MANSDLNMVALTGRLIKEGDLRYTPNGGAILRFSIACNRTRRTADGSRVDEVSYFDCVYFGKPAEALNQYLEKGRQVAINGELRQSRWEQDGQNRSRIEVYVNNLTLLASANANQSTGYRSQNDWQMQQNGYQGTQSYQKNNSYQSPMNNQQRRNTPPETADIYEGGPEDFQDDNIPF